MTTGRRDDGLGLDRVGGELLNIETVMVPGKGKMTMPVNLAR